VAKADDTVNETIDDVAREMTAGEPADAAGFRRRVLARIESGDAPRRTWRASFVLSPIAVAAAIIVALFVARERRPDTAGPKGPALQVETPQPPPAASPAARRPGPSGPGAQMVAIAAPHLDARRDRRRAEADTQPESNDVASIAVAPLAVGTLTQESIQIERLEAIEPIAVAPLDITDRSRRNQ
jgi:hypothetical protein